MEKKTRAKRGQSIVLARRVVYYLLGIEYKVMFKKSVPLDEVIQFCSKVAEISDSAIIQEKVVTWQASEVAHEPRSRA